MDRFLWICFAGAAGAGTRYVIALWAAQRFGSAFPYGTLIVNLIGACNPALADRALQAELEIGLLLPCNVIVYETATEQSVVAAMAPLAALGVVGPNPALQEVAREADERLRRALAALESATSK